MRSHAMWWLGYPEAALADNVPLAKDVDPSTRALVAHVRRLQSTKHWT